MVGGLIDRPRILAAAVTVDDVLEDCMPDGRASIYGGRRLKLLVVDDSELTLGVVGMILRRIDFVEPYFARDAAAALHMLDTAQPDLAVVDYLMPGLDGLEFIAQIRRIRVHAAIEVVMLTGVVSDQLRLAALAAGADAVIAKPIDIAAFKALLEKSHAALKDRSSD
ncbi:MAG: response regulator [Alsobacter sp.]